MANPVNETSNKANGPFTEYKGKAPILENTMNTIDSISHDAGVRIGEMASGFVRSASDAAKTSGAYVRENPLKGVAYAAAAGVAAGSLLTLLIRRSR